MEKERKAHLSSQVKPILFVALGGMLGSLLALFGHLLVHGVTVAESSYLRAPGNRLETVDERRMIFPKADNERRPAIELGVRMSHTRVSGGVRLSVNI